MHQDDRTGFDAIRAGLRQHRTGGRLVEWFDLNPVHANAAGNFLDPFIQHRRQRDREVEQPRPSLIADAQGVAKTVVYQQQGAVALALQQGIGGDGGAHFDRLD